MDFWKNFQVYEKCKNEVFLHENYIKMPQTSKDNKNIFYFFKDLPDDLLINDILCREEKIVISEKHLSIEG